MCADGHLTDARNPHEQIGIFCRHSSRFGQWLAGSIFQLCGRHKMGWAAMAGQWAKRWHKTLGYTSLHGGECLQARHDSVNHMVVHQSRKIVEFEIGVSHFGCCGWSLVGYSSYTSLVDFLDEEALDILVTLTGRDMGLALVSRLEAAPDRCGAD